MDAPTKEPEQQGEKNTACLAPSKNNKVKKAVPKEAHEVILIPEIDEAVVLTLKEFEKFLKYEKKFDKSIIEIKKAKDYEAVINAKEEFAKFAESGFKLDNENDKQETKPTSSQKQDNTASNLVGVISYTGRKFSMLPRDVAESFRKANKCYSIKEPKEGGLKEAFKKNKLIEKVKKEAYKRLAEEIFSKDVLKLLNEKIKFDWGMKCAGQIPARVALNALGLQGMLLAEIIGDENLAAFDDFIEKFNKNNEWRLQDKEKKLKELLFYIHPKQAKQDGNAPKLKEGEERPDIDKLMDNFDDELLGKIKTLVNDIWESSTEQQHIDFVEEIQKSKVDHFMKIKEDGGKKKVNSNALHSNRLELYNKTKDLKLPPYVFDASAEATLMRYAAEASANLTFEPFAGKIAGKVDAKVDLALAEGKAQAEFHLPSSEGFNLTVPQRVKKWKLINSTNIETYLADNANVDSNVTFDFDRTFVLPLEMGAVRTFFDLNEMTKISKMGYGLQIIGHTDKKATEQYNYWLSLERADVVYELLTYKFNEWARRFFDQKKYKKEQWRWGLDEFVHMIQYILGQHDKPSHKEDFVVKETGVASVMKAYENAMEIELHRVKKACTDIFCEDIRFIGGKRINMPRIDIKKDDEDTLIHLQSKNKENKFSYKVKVSTLVEVIQGYMRKGAENTFVHQNYFVYPATAGFGESNTIIDTNERERLNRRVEYLVFGRAEDGTEDIKVPLGHMKLLLKFHCSGYAGANAMLSAEIGVDVNKGMMELQGLRKGQAENFTKAQQEKHNKTKSRSKSKANPMGKKTLDESPAKGSAEAGAFAGVKATAGCKGELLWKLPEQRQGCFDPITDECRVTSADYEFKPTFVDLASVGYAVTGSAGVGLNGDFQIGFDVTSLKFVIKAKASATCGLGFGGAVEFAVSGKNMLYFVHFVYTQLNNHNFSYLELFDEDAFERFSVFCYEMAKQGFTEAVGAAALYAFGNAAFLTLETIEDALDYWYQKDDDEETAEKLVKFVAKQKTLLQHFTPEVKGRILYLLSKQGHTSTAQKFFAFIDSDTPIEQAMLTVLSTVASVNEYQNVLDSMRIPEKSEKLTDEKKKKLRAKNEALIKDILDGDREEKFIEWKKRLPAVAPKLSA